MWLNPYKYMVKWKLSSLRKPEKESMYKRLDRRLFAFKYRMDTKKDYS
jgi:hypothetical protein